MVGLRYSIRALGSSCLARAVPTARTTLNLSKTVSHRTFSCGRFVLDDVSLRPESPPASQSAKQSANVPEEAEKPDEWTQHADKLHPKIQHALSRVFEFTHLSPVQQAIVRRMPFQHDLLVRSQTGTGKTLGFLVPAVQKLFERDDELAKTLSKTALLHHGKVNPSCLIITPTRELASQIATEVRRLTTHPYTNYKALVLIGGDSLRQTLRLMRRERNDVIVATPGRILQILRDEEDFREMVGKLQTVVFDEADTLLDFGFKQDLEELVKYLPRDRQTFLFSATLSKPVRDIAKQFMKQHRYIDTVPTTGSGALSSIKQEYMYVPLHQQMITTLALINRALKQNANAKVIVFLPTTTLTSLYRQAFSVLRQLYTAEHVQNFGIHSLLNQDKRSKVSTAFRSSASGSILFTSDVSARGVDYPGIDLVIQVGAARDADIYTHKVGRTGRAGKSGHAIMLLDPILEKGFLKQLPRDLDITEASTDVRDTLEGSKKLARVTTDLQKFLSYNTVLYESFQPYANLLSSRFREYRFKEEAVEPALGAWWETLSPLPVPELRRRGRGQDHSGKMAARNTSKRLPAFSRLAHRKFAPFVGQDKFRGRSSDDQRGRGESSKKFPGATRGRVSARWQ